MEGKSMSSAVDHLLSGLSLGDAVIPLAQAAPTSGLFSGLPAMIAMFAIFYFLLIRPQQKEQKRHEEMLAAIKKGDKVVTSGGVHAVVHEVKDSVVVLEVADGVRMRFDKSAVKRKKDDKDAAASKGAA